ncbi:thioesterase domain-containing protein [Pseudomonas sp. MAFF 302046]|uniref:Thioesterase domain-containing protein n=2 Tax=Pseudomonas TaxID=286 RepID=A0ABT0JMD7_9PSED|nr:alpha/beta fold hydrolase [Pseudomonas morbosilactucae]MCK9817100.1 thioesterase domain-containing protein [Pseudomonas morbosilactucae]
MNAAFSQADAPLLERNRSAYAGLADVLEAAGLAEHALYLNWGYVPVAGEADWSADALDSAEPGGAHARLILETLAGLALDGKQLVDIGCGRGGALALMGRYFNPTGLLGVDLSAANIGYCRQRHVHPRLRFQIADACRLPQASQSADLVFNLESSGAYWDLPAFFAHVWRLLKPGGYFCYADVFDGQSVSLVKQALLQSGFVLERERSISRQVRAARRAAPASVWQRLDAALKTLGKPELREELERYLATPDSSLFDALENGAADYRIYQWRKGPVQGLVEPTVARGLVERSKRLDAAFAGQAPDRERWFPLEQPDAACGYQVFALPYAGGGASVYRQWQLPGPWKLCPVQLPGRESRIAEPSIQDMTQLVRQLVDAIRPYTDKPWALLGCSLGCKVAFEVARALASEGRHAQLLFLMACPAPSLPIQRKVSDYSEEDFAAEVRHLGGTPEQILADEQMMRTLTPILRNDSALSEGYCIAADTTLAVPMVMIAASDDHLVTVEAARRWKRHAAAGFDWRLVDGGHFFLRQQRTQLLGWLSEALQHPPR